MDRARRTAAECRPTRCWMVGGLALAVAWLLRYASPVDPYLGGAVAHDGQRLDLAAWEVVTHTVTGPALFAAILLAVCLVGGGHHGARLLVAQLLGGLAVGLLKVLDPRVRPDGGAGSWPSGHTLSAVLLALGLAAALRPRSRGVRWTALILLLAWSLAVGVSRVALGRHWPTDVLAGLGAALLLHAVSGLRSSRALGALLRTDVLRVAVLLGAFAWAVDVLVDPFPKTTPRAWALALLVLAWLYLETVPKAPGQVVATCARQLVGIGSLAAGCALAALVGSGATELWTTAEARALAAASDPSVLGGWLRELARAWLGAGSLAERWPAAVGLGLGVPAVVGLAGTWGLEHRWRLGAGLVFASAAGPLALAHRATDDSLRLAELCWLTWAAGTLATPVAPRVRAVVLAGAVVALLDLDLHRGVAGCWWVPCAALLGGAAASLCCRAGRRWVGSAITVGSAIRVVAAVAAAATLGWMAWSQPDPTPSLIGLGFLPWWSGLLVVGRRVERSAGAAGPGLVAAAWALTAAAWGGAEPLLVAVAAVPGLAIAVAARLATWESPAVGGTSSDRRPVLVGAVAVASLGLAICAVLLWTDPAAALPPAPTLAVTLLLWLGGGVVVALRCARGEAWLAVRGLAVVTTATATLLVACVWPFAMQDSMTRQIVHAAARFEVAREVLTVGVDPGPLSHYLAPPLVDAGGDDAEIVARLRAGDCGLLVDAHRLDALRRAGLTREPSARFEGFVPHAWQRQVWLWFAP